MAVASFKTVSVGSGAGSTTSSGGGSSIGKYVVWGIVIAGALYAGYKFIIEPRMKANRENNDD